MRFPGYIGALYRQVVLIRDLPVLMARLDELKRGVSCMDTHRDSKGTHHG